MAGSDAGGLTRSSRVPPAAVWLGVFGALPFVSIAGLSLFLESPNRELASFAITAYGALILSFLGGVHWGLAIAGYGPGHTANDTVRRLAVSVVPSLIGWAALFFPRPVGAVILAVAFGALVLFDVYATRNLEAPAWYPKLRLPLTSLVIAALMVSAFS